MKNKLYRLYVNGEFDGFMWFEREPVQKRGEYILRCWEHAQKYGHSVWTGRPKPVIDIRYY